MDYPHLSKDKRTPNLVLVAPSVKVGEWLCIIVNRQSHSQNSSILIYQNIVISFVVLVVPRVCSQTTSRDNIVISLVGRNPQ